MADNNQLYNTVAPLRNVSALVSLIDKVENRTPGLPGLAVFYGYSGFGKTTAAVYAANECDAYQVQMKSTWTQKKLCQSLLLEMSIEPAKTIADMVDQISEELALSNRVLIVDEADFLVKRNMIEIVRDIYESSGSPVILIGEERLPTNLQKWERVHGRVLAWLPAEPACLEDVDHLARIYAPDIKLDLAFKKHLLKASQLSIRRVCVNLELVSEYSRIHGGNVVDLAAWKGQKFIPCHAPKPRGMQV